MLFCWCWFVSFRQYKFIVVILVVMSGCGIVLIDVYAFVIESVGVGTCVSVWVYVCFVSFTSVGYPVVGVSWMVVVLISVLSVFMCCGCSCLSCYVVIVSSYRGFTRFLVVLR